MKYKNETFNTVEGVFNKALELVDTDELSQFFKAYIQHIYEDANDIHTLEEAKERAKSNFEHLAAYCCDKNIQKSIKKLWK